MTPTLSLRHPFQKKKKKTRQKVGFYYQLVHFIIMYHLSVDLGRKTFQ